MATLTEAGYLTRRIISWTIVALVAIALAPILLRGAALIILALNPPKAPPPEMRYGSLPSINLPQIPNDTRPSLILETKTGDLPSFPNQMRVYPIQTNKLRLLEIDRIKTRASSLGFTSEPEKLNDHAYRFKHPTAPIELNVDIISNGLSYKYNWAVDQSFYASSNLPSRDEALNQAKTFFQTLGVLPSDMASGTPKYSYFSSLPGGTLKLVPQLEANVIRVDLFRSDIEINKTKYKVVTPFYSTSPVNVIITGLTGNKKIIEAAYNYSALLDAEKEFSTYPIKTVQAAWEELRQGGGYVAHVDNQTSTIKIRGAYLAYYETEAGQQFLQPIFVFEGDEGFAGYVEAISKN